MNLDSPGRARIGATGARQRAQQLHVAYAEGVGAFSRAITCAPTREPVGEFTSLPRQRRYWGPEPIELVRRRQLVPAACVAKRGDVIPVGAHGAALAMRPHEARDMMWGLGFDIGARMELPGFRARGKLSVGERSAAKFLRFGGLSVVQALAQFSSHRVPGFDDPFILLQAIARTDAITELSQRLPISVLGPMTMASRLFPAPLLVPDSDGVVMAPEFRRFLVAEKRDYLADLGATPGRRQAPRKLADVTTAGRGCPVDFTPLIQPTVDWIAARQRWVGGIADPPTRLANVLARLRPDGQRARN